MFIDVHKCKKLQVWAEINVPFENSSAQWDKLKIDKRLMTEWSSFLDSLGVSEGTVENITNALKIESPKMEEIIEFGVVSPKLFPQRNVPIRKLQLYQGTPFYSTRSRKLVKESIQTLNA